MQTLKMELVLYTLEIAVLIHFFYFFYKYSDSDSNKPGEEITQFVYYLKVFSTQSNALNETHVCLNITIYTLHF